MCKLRTRARKNRITLLANFSLFVGAADADVTGAAAVRRAWRRDAAHHRHKRTARPVFSRPRESNSRARVCCFVLLGSANATRRRRRPQFIRTAAAHTKNERIARLSQCVCSVVSVTSKCVSVAELLCAKSTRKRGVDYCLGLGVYDANRKCLLRLFE